MVRQATDTKPACGCYSGCRRMSILLGGLLIACSLADARAADTAGDLFRHCCLHAVDARRRRRRQRTRAAAGHRRHRRGHPDGGPAVAPVRLPCHPGGDHTADLLGALPGQSQAGTYTEAGLLGLTYSPWHCSRTIRRAARERAPRRPPQGGYRGSVEAQRLHHPEHVHGVVAVDGERNLVLLNNAARRLLGTPCAQRR